MTSGWNVIQAVENCHDAFIEEKLNFKLVVNSSKSMTDFYCPSCYCEYEPEEIHTMSDCGHMICKDCLREYILQKLGEGMKVVYTKCFSSPCGNIIP